MSVTIDMQKSEAFAGRMLATLNGAAVALMASLGHRTGLFDTMSRMADTTSRQLADAAGLSERYVREWLGAMTAGGVVEHDPTAGTYRLPPEHAGFLTRAAGVNNLAGAMQWVAVLGAVEDEVADAFRHGRGVPYSSYKRFHEVMAEESEGTTVGALEQHILPLVPGLAERLRAGLDVLDIGCGVGRALIKLAGLFPNSRFVGYDFSAEGVGAGRAAADRAGLGNVWFEVQDVAQMTEREAFDLVTAFDAVHDQAYPARVLRNVAAALRPGGTFLMQEIRTCGHPLGTADQPLLPFIYTISCLHCMSVSLASGGPGLGAAWGKPLALKMLAEAGFRNLKVTTLPHDLMNDYYVAAAPGGG